jgi:hypothetical protein
MYLNIPLQEKSINYAPSYNTNYVSTEMSKALLKCKETVKNNV